MAYDPAYGSPQQQKQQQQQPYEQPSLFNNSPPPPQQPLQQQQPHNDFFHQPYPQHYDHPAPGGSRVPSQPQQQPYVAPAAPPGPGPAAAYPPPGQQQHPPPPQPQSSCPPPNPAADPYYDPSRSYQTHSSSINQAAAAAFQSAGAGPGSGQPQPPPPPQPPPGPDRSSAYLSPEVLSQITASVVQQLRGTSLETSPTQAQPQPQPQPQPQFQSQPQQPQHFSPHASEMPPFPAASVSTQSDYSSSAVNPNIYTPPSPNRSAEEQIYSSPQLGSQPQYMPSSQETVRPSFEPDAHTPSPYPEMERPSGPTRRSTARDETTMEKIWGKFFDGDGRPTPRLGQFLRGIAAHLIEGYPPGDTLVIRPEKMQKYYQDIKVPGDTYPWQDIFNDRTSSISRLYRDIHAEHHLVQDLPHEKPDIPGLTPRGFQRWMTLMIQAHPDQEFERLQRTVLEMPINNPDDKTERFPKELSRRLLPKSNDKTARDLLEDNIITHCKIKASVFSAKKSSRSGTHRSRAPASPDPPLSPLGFDQADDDPENSSPSRPIERERQPYSVQPGGGRTYEDSPIPRSISPIEVPPINFRDGGNRDEWTRSPPGTNSRYKPPAADDSMGHSPNDGEPYGSPTPPAPPPDDQYEKRHRNHDKEKGRKESRRHDGGKEHRRDRDKRRHHERPSRVSWASDEDYYRPPGSVGGRSGDPYDQHPVWPGRY